MLYNVKVRFSSDGRISVQGDEVTVSIKSAPENGKANRELIEILSHHFGVNKRRLIIVSGHTSRNKLVELR